MKLHYTEAGTQEPPVLLLHGIPTNVYLWRDVIPHLAPNARTIAFDLIGFGKSDKPLNIEYNLQTQTAFLENAIEILKLKKIIIVAMDLGLIVGLNYAMRHEANMAGIVMFEGFFQPIPLVVKNLPYSIRFVLKMMQIKKLAELFLIRDKSAVEHFLRNGTVRRLKKEEIDQYREPMKDALLRKKYG